MSAKTSSPGTAAVGEDAAAARPEPTGPGILTLPQELLFEILNLLPIRDWTSLRLVCRDLAWRMLPFASIRVRGSSGEVGSRLQQLLADHKRERGSTPTGLVCARIRSASFEIFPSLSTAPQPKPVAPGQKVDVDTTQRLLEAIEAMTRLDHLELLFDANPPQNARRALGHLLQKGASWPTVSFLHIRAPVAMLKDVIRHKVKNLKGLYIPSGTQGREVHKAAVSHHPTLSRISVSKEFGRQHLDPVRRAISDLPGLKSLCIYSTTDTSLWDWGSRRDWRLDCYDEILGLASVLRWQLPNLEYLALALPHSLFAHAGEEAIQIWWARVGIPIMGNIMPHLRGVWITSDGPRYYFGTRKASPNPGPNGTAVTGEMAIGEGDAALLPWGTWPYGLKD